MTHYLALIHKEPDSDHGVMFPDFPGCVSAGPTLDEAIRHAAEALSLHVAGMREDGEAIPPPSTMDEIRAVKADWIDPVGATVVAVPLLPPQGRSVRVNITIDERLLMEIDAVTGNRSAFLAEAARRALSGTA